MSTRKKKPIIYRREFITIETPDKIRLEYRIANPLLRFGAFFIDLVIMVIVFLLIYWLLSRTALLNELGRVFEDENEEVFTGILNAILLLLFFIFRWGYYLAFEMIFEGKTPGKFICGIRTIHYRGQALDFSTLVLRNFARLVDEVDFLLTALVCMLINREYRRVGDLMANTIVVKDERLMEFGRAFAFSLPAVAHHGLPEPAPLLRRLTEEELYTVRRLLVEQGRIRQPGRGALLADVAGAVREKIRDREEVKDPLAYLVSVWKRHEESRAVK